MREEFDMYLDFIDDYQYFIDDHQLNQLIDLYYDQLKSEIALTFRQFLKKKLCKKIIICA